MNTLTDATAPTRRAPAAAANAAAASPWSRRPASLWNLFVQSWRETMDIYARTGFRPLWGWFW